MREVHHELLNPLSCGLYRSIPRGHFTSLATISASVWASPTGPQPSTSSASPTGPPRSHELCFPRPMVSASLSDSLGQSLHLRPLQLWMKPERSRETCEERELTLLLTLLSDWNKSLVLSASATPLPLESLPVLRSLLSCCRHLQHLLPPWSRASSRTLIPRV